MVSGRLQQEGWTLISSQGDNQIDPSIWFSEKAGRNGSSSVLCDSGAEKADRPAHWQQIVERFAGHAKVGHFASVAVASKNDAFDPDGSV